MPLTVLGFSCRNAPDGTSFEGPSTALTEEHRQTVAVLVNERSFQEGIQDTLPYLESRGLRYRVLSAEEILNGPLQSEGNTTLFVGGGRG